VITGRCPVIVDVEPVITAAFAIELHLVCRFGLSALVLGGWELEDDAHSGSIRVVEGT